MTAFLGNIMGTVLRFIYDFVSGIGTEPENFSYYAMSIIIATIVFELIQIPLTIKQKQTTKKMNKIQPKMEALQKKYKDPETLNMKMAELYQEENFNPAAGCLIPLIQLPIIIALFAVFREPAKYAFSDPGMYEKMNKSFLWITNLENPDPYFYGLPLLAAATTYLQSKLMMPQAASGGKDSQMQSTQQTMTLMMPVIIFMSARSFAAGLALYWVGRNIMSIIQTLIIDLVLEGDSKEGK